MHHYSIFNGYLMIFIPLPFPLPPQSLIPIYTFESIVITWVPLIGTLIIPQLVSNTSITSPPFSPFHSDDLCGHLTFHAIICDHKRMSIPLYWSAHWLVLWLISITIHFAYGQEIIKVTSQVLINRKCLGYFNCFVELSCTQRWGHSVAIVDELIGFTVINCKRIS